MTVLHHPPRTDPSSPSLTDRYLDAVARGVPRTHRDEVTARVRTSIQSDVAERVTAGVPAMDAEWQSLNDRGDPTRLADAEAGPRWLIGPLTYPTYVRVLRTVSVIVLPLVAALVALGSGLAGENALEVVVSSLSAAVGAAVQVAFWVTVVFAVLDRRGVVLGGGNGAWTPADLREPPRTGVGLGETIVGIAVQVLLIGLVLWPWQYWPSADADPVPVLNLDLRPEVTAVLVAVLAAGIVLTAATYWIGHWTMSLAAVNTVLDVTFAVVVIWLVASGRLFDPAFVEALGDSPVVDTGQAGQAVNALGVLIAAAVGFACGVDLLDGWRKALRTRR